MDALVAQHSRPAGLQAFDVQEDNQDDLTFSPISLSLKFALPPLANVRPPVALYPILN